MKFEEHFNNIFHIMILRQRIKPFHVKHIYFCPCSYKPSSTTFLALPHVMLCAISLVTELTSTTWQWLVTLSEP